LGSKCIAKDFVHACQKKLNRLAVRSSKKSPNQKTGLGNRGRLKVLIDIKVILND
jgi:hypothetical protein